MRFWGKYGKISKDDLTKERGGEMAPEKKGMREHLAGFFRREWTPCLIVAVLFAARLLAMDALNVTYTLGSDDMSYIRSGIYLAQTGTLTMHDTYPTAQIMPALSAVIAVFYLIFGEGTRLWLALKLFWSAMGALSGYFLYKSVRLFAPGWCAAVAALMLLRTDFLWADNIILTETPFLLCTFILIYCTFQMGKGSGKRRYPVGFLLAFLAAFLLRANIAWFPLFAGGYLLAVKYDRRRLVKQGLTLLLALLGILTPWTVRNYMHFHAFLPLGYGVGNPMLLGTYQGYGYPADEELDYGTHVDAVAREKYADYYGPDGTVMPQYDRYVRRQTDVIKANYRKTVWREKDPVSYYVSYLVLKPLKMMDSVFYWHALWGIPNRALRWIQRFSMAVCLLGLLVSFRTKKARKEMVFTGAVYFGYVWISCVAFAFDRYNMDILPAQLVLLGLSLYNMGTLWGEARRAGMEKKKG